MKNLLKSSCLIMSVLPILTGAQVSGQDLTHPRDMVIPKSKFKRPDPAKYQLKLDNGLVAYVAKEDQVPLVSLSAFIKAGKIDGSKEGAAETLVEAFLTGPKDMSSATFKKALKRMTAEYSVMLHNKWIEINLNIPVEDLEEAFELFSKTIISPNITEANIKIAARKATNKIKIDKNGVIVDGSSNVAVNKFHDIILKGNILGKKLTSRDFKNLSINDVKGFYAAYVVANNITIAVSGDIDEKAIRKKLKAQFSALINKTPPNRRNVAKIKRQKSKVHYFPADKLQSWMVIGHHLPLVSLKDETAFEVMNYILAGGHFWTRMFIETRDKYGLTNDASGYIEDQWNGSGSYSFHSSSRHDVTKQLYDNIMGVIYKIQKDLVSDEELMIAHNALADGVYEMKFKDGDATARSFAIEKLRYGNHDRSKSYPTRVRAVTKKDVLRVAKKYMHPDAFQVIIVGERTKIR
tara:strand:- start:188 stop:1579 length:1392 start_codon:yes stop_codon:yes gene_type:complete